MHHRRFVTALAVAFFAVSAPLAAQSAAECAGEACALRIEYRPFGDRIVRADGSIAARSLTTAALRNAVSGVSAAEAFAEAHRVALRKSTQWGLLSTAATVGFFIAANNGLYRWDSGHRIATLGGTIAATMVSSIYSSRYGREVLGRRQQAIDAYNAARR